VNASTPGRTRSFAADQLLDRQGPAKATQDEDERWVLPGVEGDAPLGEALLGSGRPAACTAGLFRSARLNARGTLMALLLRRRGPTAVVMAAVAFSVLALLAPSVAASPAPSDPGADIATGREGTRAALVRVEVSAFTTIVHLDHSTGDLHVVEGRYLVRQSQATGVLVSADGVVATLWRELAVDPNRVVVPAANRLFVDKLGAQLEDGNDATGRTHATDPEIDEHLQDCYEQRIDHCIAIPELHYDVVPLTTEPRRVRALLINEPSTMTDVALLRIGAAAMPTATLAEGQTVPPTGEVLGFEADAPKDDAEQAEWRPVAVPVDVDGTTVTAPPDEGLDGRLDRGLTGGPIIDPDTGAVTALVDRDRATGRITAVSGPAVRSALDQAGITPERSPFDVAFDGGLRLLNDGEFAAAGRQLDQARQYFDSALAAEYAETAEEQATGVGPATGDAAEEDAGRAPAWLWWALALVALMLAALLWWLWSRRRGRAPADPRADRAAEPVVREVASHPTPTPNGAHAVGYPVGVGLRAGPETQVRPTIPPAGPPTGARSSQHATQQPSLGAPLDRPGADRPGAEHDAFCVHCGQPLPLRGRFCGQCGEAVRP
jgi:hypothetical protein